MSGDVQPRKRKDKKKKKDELGAEEPRGTAAALGDGDVFIHSQQDHGTGGHWCAKLIFFSLLAVLITLIGLIILENRGLTELEANSVESRYSGVLEGWLEDAPDDHHDEHTLDLKHHDDEEDEDEHNIEQSDHEDEDHDEEDHDDEDEEEEENDDQEDHDEDKESHEEDTEADEDEVDQDESHERNTEADEDEEENVASNEVDSNEDQDDNQSEENLQDEDNEEGEEEVYYKQYNYKEDDNDDGENDENEDGDYADDNQDSEYDDESDDDDQKDKYEDDDEQENNEDQNDVYKYDDIGQTEDQSIEDNNDRYGDDDDSKEIKTQDADFSREVIYDDNNQDDDNNSSEQKDNKQDIEDEEEQEDDSQENEEEEIEKLEKEIIDEDEDSNEIVASRHVDEDEQVSKEDQEADDDDDDLQDQEGDDDEPPLERITAPLAGKPFVEIEEEIIEKPINTLAEEEEYEKRQEQLRREEDEAAQGSQMWLKLAVGGALLAATHAVLRRATAPRDIPEPEELTREETPVVDRRMTIIPEQSPPLTQIAREIEEEVFKKPASVTKSAPIVKQDSEEELIVKKAPVEEKAPAVDIKDDKELYSDEEEEVEDEEEEEDIEEPVKEAVQKKAVPVAEQKPNEDSEPEDVEIIDDEQIEEELEDEENEDEEEISDVDDTELLTRLEAKYGRLPEPERFGKKPESFGPKHKDGGNSIEDEWPGEPSDAYWRTELNVAEEELRQGAWSACERRVSVAALASSGRARWLAARALDLAAEEKRDNSLLSRAIAAYLHLLKMNERLSDKKLLEVAQRAIERIQFRGTYLNAEPIYRLLIRRFPDDVNYRNNLTVSFLMANRADLADEVLKETLRLWPNDRVALAHHGFVLKTKYNKLEEAVNALCKALEGDAGPANEPRFYYHLGDALLLLGRPAEAHEVHKRGAALGHFLSPAQRSLYNVPRLRSRPWWPVEETPYVNLARALERSWREILKEGEAAKALYEKEKEGLKERGEWTQLDLFMRGAEVAGRCARAPVTCAIVRGEAAAARCRRGQVKFSALAAGTHVRAHVGPTNCRLRMHLGLSNTKDTYIRVDQETRQWQTGKTFMFDDSFEHEVWHNGSGARLVLIVDVWHPDLSAHERRTLPAI